MNQRQRLRELFKSMPNTWISLSYILSMGIAQYNARILEIRRDKNNPMNIQNRTLFKNGTQYSWFMWIPETKVQKEMEFA